MLDTLFFLISRLNNACSPLVFNLQINLAIGIKDNPFLSFQLWRLIRRGKQALFNLEIKKKGDQVLISIFTILKFSAQFTQIHAGSWMRTFNSTVHAILNDPSPGMSGIISLLRNLINSTSSTDPCVYLLIKGLRYMVKKKYALEIQKCWQKKRNNWVNTIIFLKSKKYSMKK